MQTPSPDASTREKLRFLWVSYIRQQKRTLLWAIFFGGIAAATAGFGIPYMMEHVFPVVFGKDPLPEGVEAFLRQYFAPEDLPDVTLWAAAAMLPLVMMVRGMAAFMNVFLLSKAGLRILENLRLAVFSRLQELPLAYHERFKQGELISRVIHNTQFLQSGMLTIMNDVVIQPLTLVAAMTYLVVAALNSEQVPVLLVNMVVATLCIPIIKKVGSAMLKKMRDMMSGLGDITATVQENLSAQRDVRAFNMEAQQEETFLGQIRRMMTALFRMTVCSQALTPVIEILSAVALAYALYMGCSHGLTLEQFTAIALALYYCYDPIKRLGTVHNQYKLTLTLVDSLLGVLSAKDETPEPERPVPLKHPRGEVRFEHVNFAYVTDNPVLRDVDVHVPAGQIVALVGPSGSGKTTFINLLCRFYDVVDGSVKIDGVDVRDVSRKDRTEAVGLVSQHPVMFHTTIKENIRMGRQDATDEEVFRAGALASVNEFTEQHADGYEREIGEGGEGLSGGQRQRVSIARAFLKNAPILILDEATASLDMTSEARIQASLNELAKGHTTFVIAHRFSTIRMAHRILVFESGRIVADGSHEELYASSTLYRDLYDKQIMHAGKEAAV